VVLFGGRASPTSPTTFGDTWEYDGTTWTQVLPPVSPSPRAYAAMAFDPATQRPMLVGGLTPAPLGDAWALQAGSWVALPPSPGGAALGFLALDRGSNRLVHLNNDTGVSSSWNGAAWAPLATTNLPGGAAGIGSDPSTGDLLFFTPQLHSPATRIAPPAPPAVAQVGVGCAPGTPPRLIADVPWLGNPRFLLEARDIGAGGICVFGLAASTASQPLGNCTLLLGGSPTLLDAVANPAGVAGVTLPIPVQPPLRGAVVYAQAGTLGPAGFALTAGLRLVVGD